MCELGQQNKQLLPIIGGLLATHATDIAKVFETKWAVYSIYYTQLARVLNYNVATV